MKKVVLHMSLIATLSLYAMEDETNGLGKLTLTEQLSKLTVGGNHFLSGALKGGYKSLVGASFSLSAYYLTQEPGLNASTAFHTTLLAPQALDIMRSHLKRRDLSLHPNKQDWPLCKKRKQVEQSVSFNNMMERYGRATGSLAVILGSYKLIQCIPEDQLKKWVIGGLLFSYAAWQTKDFCGLFDHKGYDNLEDTHNGESGN